MEVGTKVEWVRPDPSYRRWFGTIRDVSEDGTMLLVEWITRVTTTKLKWEPVTEVFEIDEIPDHTQKSKTVMEELIDEVVLPQPYFEWHMDAKCYANGSTDFVGYSTLRPPAKLRRKLIEACEGCPVMMICRAEAVKTDSVGWWGGMDEPSRMRWVESLTRKTEYAEA